MTAYETRAPSRNPYQPVGDFLSNVHRFKISKSQACPVPNSPTFRIADNHGQVESTLREGEQFANAFFTQEKKIESRYQP